MQKPLNEILWHQIGAAIDTLELAIQVCPESVWRDRSLQPEYWYTAYHTIFWLDYYLSETGEGFQPPAPYNLDEMDPAGLLPDRVYTQAEMLAYLEHDRTKTRARLATLTEEELFVPVVGFGWMKFSLLEQMLYTLRHVQHHAAQLNMHLRQTTNSSPRWVSVAKTPLNAE